MPGLWKMPWRRAWQSTPVFLPAESYGQRSHNKVSDTAKVAQQACMIGMIREHQGTCVAAVTCARGKRVGDALGV